MDVTQERQIVRINQHGTQLVKDVLLQEAAYKLIVNDRPVKVFHCLPEKLEQLAVGYALSRGMLTDIDQIEKLIINESRREILLSLRSDHAIRTLVPAAKETVFTSAQIQALFAEFEKHCDLFRLTGAAHSCALATNNGIEIFMNDVARHNCLDKVNGEMLLKQVNSAGKALIFSGRLACDLIGKAIKSDVRILIAPGAPTLAAVELAEKSDLTLLGFVRNDNINIYTHWQRIKDH